MNHKYYLYLFQYYYHYAATLNYYHIRVSHNMTIRMVSASKLTKIASASNPIVAVFFLAVGYYLGSQHALIVSYNNSSSSSSSSSSTGFIHSQVPPSKSFATSKNQAADTAPSKLFATSKNYQVANINTTGDGTKDASAFRLHPHIELSEDPGLFRKIVYPLVRKLVESGEVTNCPLAPVKPYLDILKNIEESPSYYEDSNVKNSNQTCPVVFLFYFEGGSGMAETFFDFYSNIRTKRCLNFIVSSRWKDHEQTKKIEDNGYTIVGASYPEQTQTISMSLDEIKKQYGDDVLVSVNDLDHLLVWFDLAGKPHRYSIYTEMVKLYAYELLSTRGCSNQNVHEKYVVPCTCLMEKNEKYISTTEDGVVWSEYGVTNRFHPTANFYLNKSLETKAEKSPYAYSVGTVFANLRLYEVSPLSHIY